MCMFDYNWNHNAFISFIKIYYVVILHSEWHHCILTYDVLYIPLFNLLFCRLSFIDSFYFNIKYTVLIMPYWHGFSCCYDVLKYVMLVILLLLHIAEEVRRWWNSACWCKWHNSRATARGTPPLEQRYEKCLCKTACAIFLNCRFTVDRICVNVT